METESFRYKRTIAKRGKSKNIGFRVGQKSKLNSLGAGGGVLFNADVALPFVARRELQRHLGRRGGEVVGDAYCATGRHLQRQRDRGRGFGPCSGFCSSLTGSSAEWRKCRPLIRPQRLRCGPYPETWPEKLFSLDLGNLLEVRRFRRKPRGFDSVGEGVDFLRLLLEFGNRVLHPLGPGRVILVGQIDLARRQVRLDELVGRLIARQIDDHHARRLAGYVKVTNDDLRLGDLVRLRVTLRFERQRQLELAQGEDVLGLRGHLRRPTGTGPRRRWARNPFSPSGRGPGR